MSDGSAAGKVAVVLKGYPRLSETFIAQELLALEARGVALTLFALRRPTDSAVHPIHAAIAAPVGYLPEYLHHDMRRVLKAWWKMRGTDGYRAARALWWRDFRRDRTRNRLRRFGQALVLASELPDDVVHLHAHFLHTPASVTRYAAHLSGRAWSCSAHAKDIFTIPDWEVREKLADCVWLATCTASNVVHLRAIAGPDAAIDLVYHGIDTHRFPAPPPRGDHVATTAREPVRMLTIGRAVDKKGFDDLLHALALLPPTLHWHLVHVGGGPLIGELQALAGTLGIAARITWRGAQAHEAVLAAYREADLFVLPCRVSSDGDRDGLPNVLMEAQSQRLACVSTRISGIPELIEDGVTGMLVAPRDPVALARTLAELVADADLRTRLGAAGFARVTQHFALDAGADRLKARFAAALSN
ncbi:MAG: glycosyltransferase family 4 protein [Casimicrobiaceae bacterium]